MPRGGDLVSFWYALWSPLIQNFQVRWEPTWISPWLLYRYHRSLRLQGRVAMAFLPPGRVRFSGHRHVPVSTQDMTWECPFTWVCRVIVGVHFINHHWKTRVPITPREILLQPWKPYPSKTQECGVGLHVAELIKHVNCPPRYAASELIPPLSHRLVGSLV